MLLVWFDTLFMLYLNQAVKIILNKPDLNRGEFLMVWQFVESAWASLFQIKSPQDFPNAFKFLLHEKCGSASLTVSWIDACPFFSESWLSYSLAIKTSEIPQCDIAYSWEHFVQSDRPQSGGLIIKCTVCTQLYVLSEFYQPVLGRFKGYTGKKTACIGY